MSSKRRTGVSLLVPMIGEVGIVIVVQFIPLVSLSIVNYAAYSAVYLFFGVSYGLVLATVCDIWARQIRRSSDRAGHLVSTKVHSSLTTERPIEFGGALLHAAILAGVGNGILALLMFPIEIALLATLSTVFGICRSGNRYYLLATGRSARAGVSDAAGASAGLILWVVVHVFSEVSVTTVFWAWLLTGLLSLLVGNIVLSPTRYGIVVWFRANWIDIRSLLGEALVMNVSSVSTPYVAGLIGGSFAMSLVRASSSLLYPIRLILGIIRPRLISHGVKNLKVSVVVVTMCAVLLGIIMAGALRLVSSQGLFPGTALDLLSAHFVPMSILIVVSAVSVFAQFEAKGRLSGRALFIRRLVHSTLVVLGTGGAIALWGAGAALIGLTSATALTIPLWLSTSFGPTIRIDRIEGT